MLDALRQRLASWIWKDAPRSEGNVSEYAALAVPPTHGRAQPAQWVLDRNEFVRHLKGSVFIAVGAIARRVAMQEAKVSRRVIDESGRRLEPVPLDHPLVQLFEEVNPIHTQFDLWYQTVAWRLTTGDAFWWIARNGLRTPAQLWPLPSQWVHAIPSEEEFISGYKVEGVFGRPREIPARDVVHLREPNLDWARSGRFYGRPPLWAAAETVDLEETLIKRLFHQHRNFAPPALKYKTDKDLTETQMRQAFTQIRSQHSRTEQTGDPIVLHSGFDAEEFSAGVREIDYAASLDALMTRNLAIYGVPKAVVGIVSEANRSNMLASMVAFCKNVIDPLLVHLGQHLTQGLARQFEDDLVVHFDPCEVEDAVAMREDVLAAIKVQAIAPNEARDLLLGLGPFKQGGDRPLVNQALVPAEFGNEEVRREEAAHGFGPGEMAVYEEARAQLRKGNRLDRNLVDSSLSLRNGHK